MVMGAGSIFALLFAGCAAFAPSLTIAQICFGLFAAESTFVLPSLYIGIQLLTPNRFRGVAASFNMMVYTLAGLGIGPAAVGAISDRLHAADRSLGFAIVIVECAMVAIIVPTALWARRDFERNTLSSSR